MSRTSWPSVDETRERFVEAVRTRLTTRPSVESMITFGVVAAAVLFTLMQLQPRLLIAHTTPAGGDTGSHVWGPAFLRDHLLPKGRISGWAPDWYDGFPAYMFYFPLPAVMIALLSYVLPYGIAFKLITVLGILTLPVACWAFGRLSGMRFPGPALLAVASVLYLFDRGFTIYGGNIASTLAGEFAFSISLSFAMLFLGVVARGLDNGKHRVLAGVLLALTGLSHLLPTVFAVVGASSVVRSASGPSWPPSGRSRSPSGSRTPTTWAGRRSPSTARTSSRTTCGGWSSWPWAAPSSAW
jgi:uncharacterized membrane protein